MTERHAEPGDLIEVIGGSNAMEGTDRARPACTYRMRVHEVTRYANLNGRALIEGTVTESPVKPRQAERFIVARLGEHYRIIH